MDDCQISSPLVWKTVDVESILIGKVLSNRSYTRSAIVNILQKAWNLQTGFDVIEVSGNTFLFSFSDGEEYNRILRGRPWSINGCLLNLMERSKFKACEDFDFSRCPAWIQMHNVPMEAWCLDNAIMIGSHVGEVMLAEDPLYNGKYLRNFLRARVVLDLRKPLAYGFWLPKPDGSKVWISIRYEKLQNFCYACGKIGHDNRQCRSERLMSISNPTEPRFGPWITTNACRVWEEVLTVVRSNWEEAAYFKKKKDEAELRKKLEFKQRADKEADVVEGDLFFIKVRSSSGEERSRDPGKSQVEEESEVRVCEAMNRILSDVSNKNYPTPLADEVNKRKDEVLKDAGGAGEMSEGNLGGHKEALNDKPLKSPESVLMQPLGGGIAEEELMPLTFKRRKLVKKDQGSLKSAISSYANSLKKVKARMRKATKRKSRDDEKENMLEEVLCPDDIMEDSLDADPLGTTFVFKAKGAGGR
ncbi:hypothetical protein K1719_033467 [Acacia pycnantha]|nr:hypothetical protein K1719_033467 [Acacia pycnantha]